MGGSPRQSQKRLQTRKVARGGLFSGSTAFVAHGVGKPIRCFSADVMPGACGSFSDKVHTRHTAAHPRKTNTEGHTQPYLVAGCLRSHRTLCARRFLGV